MKSEFPHRVCILRGWRQRSHTLGWKEKLQSRIVENFCWNYTVSGWVCRWQQRLFCFCRKSLPQYTNVNRFWVNGGAQQRRFPLLWSSASNMFFLQLCDHKTGHVCLHRGRNEFSRYKKGSCSITQLLSRPKVSKGKHFCTMWDPCLLGPATYNMKHHPLTRMYFESKSEGERVNKSSLKLRPRKGSYPLLELLKRRSGSCNTAQSSDICKSWLPPKQNFNASKLASAKCLRECQTSRKEQLAQMWTVTPFVVPRALGTTALGCFCCSGSPWIRGRVRNESVTCLSLLFILTISSLK